MMWTDESGNRLKSFASRQTSLSDGTYERFEKINVSAKHGTEQTFVCIATGDSLNGTSTKELILLPISGKREIVCLILGLIIGILAVVPIPVFLLRKFLQKNDQDCLPQKVSEESPPTVETTMNSEDESRKWYSVQWSDFKLCCSRLKDVSTQNPRMPFWLYALYRFELAAYFFLFWVTYIVLGVEKLGPKFFIYLPVWTYTAATSYVFFALFNAVMDFVKSRKSTAFEDKFRYQIQWCLFNITATPSIVVTFLYYDLMFYALSEKVPILLYISIHILPTIVCLLDIFITLIVVRFLHAVYPSSCLIAYLLFTVIYWMAEGTDSDGNPSVSGLLDFGNEPGKAAATTIGVSFLTLFLQAVLKTLYALRVRHMDKERTEIVLTVPGEQPSARMGATNVELEKLN
ncbi:protein rolling stone-like [Diadema antillarum]|uniref:protein rolling stone-like n=1 Tax=Diadema antillarum TaxID=105358 RepID=UPI003A87BD19